MRTTRRNNAAGMTVDVRSARRHWLFGVVAQAGLKHVEKLVLDCGMAITDAWAEVCKVCRIKEEVLAKSIADHFRLKIADLNTAEARALKLIPENVAHRLQVYPMRENDRELVAATSDPTDLEAEEALGFASGRKPVFEVVPPATLKDAIDAAYRPDSALENLLAGVDADITGTVDVVIAGAPEAVAERDVESGPVVKLANVILRDAVQQSASDIHIEPGRTGGSVRFRVDGLLRHYMQLPMPALTRVVSRLKILGDMDITDRLRPQDGSARIRVQSHVYDLRISTVPTRDAEKAVIRILDPESSVGLDDLDAGPEALVQVRKMINNREGIFIVTGPTGSGKTTTVYAALRELSTGEVNIMTVEDPIEYELAEITQIEVDKKQGVTFASALRAILRQDPDVILVGEIRDLETAEIAVQASLTGHLVLATLHTNDAVGVVARLRDLGLDKSSLAESLRGAVGQRLVRRLCTDCAVKIGRRKLTVDESRLSVSFGVKPVMRAVGCGQCGETGFRGRVPVMETLLVTEEIAELISNGTTTQALRRAAADEGMRTFREAALERVADGTTTLSEVERALGDKAEQPLTEAAGDSDAIRILVVDDDAVNRKLARALLEKSGFEVSEAEDGEAALAHLSSGASCDLMVLDLNMPRLDGRRVLQRVRADVATAGLPVVILTGSGIDEAEVTLMEEGADDYICKPIDPPRFVARVKATLRRAGA